MDIEEDTRENNLAIECFCILFSYKDPEEERWIKVVPTYNVMVHKETVICKNNCP